MRSRAILSFLQLAAALAWCLSASVAWAQESPNYSAFDSFAAVVQKDLQEKSLSDSGLEGLRAELVRWREQFLDAQDVNAVEIEALNAQLEALDPPPPDGATEPSNVANRRADINAALETAREPRVKAEEAYARADALIGQVDATLRTRQTDALLTLQKTPLDPALWPETPRPILAVGQAISTELSENLSEGVFTSRLPLALVLLLAGVMLVLRGPTRVEQLLARIESSSSEHGRILYGFLVSFGSVLVPMLGISLLNAALISTGILGETGRNAALGINTAILTYAVSRWLGGRIFPERDVIPSPLVLSDEQRTEGRFLTRAIGLFAGLLFIVRFLDLAEGANSEPFSVLLLPVFVIKGIILFRLGRLIWLGGQADQTEEGSNFSDRMERLLGRSVQAVAIVAPLAAAVGYFNLARALLIPTVLTLAVIALLASLHYAVKAGYALARQLDREQAGQALPPVLVSFALSLLSLPLIALIWGARETDLLEVWARFRAGVKLGETTISPGDFLTFAIVFGLGYMMTRLMQGTLRSSVLPRTRMDKGGQNAIVAGLGYFGLTIAAVAGITAAGIDLSSFAIIVGALGVGIGFGLQNIVNNFVSGIILLIERPISEGDWVEVNGQMGTVRAISVRSTVIETFDRRDVIVPNGDFISGTVTNWTRGNSLGRVIVPVGVAYGTDTRRVEQILTEIAEKHPIVSINPPPNVFFRGFGADSLDFEIRAILKDVSYIMSAHSDMNHEIARRFAEEGIEIPFAQRDIWLRNPEALGPARENSQPSDAITPSDRPQDDPDGDGGETK